jgi:N-methylhydantoinase A/oxoprolinase/acetone carboxylase beta subunit
MSYRVGVDIGGTFTDCVVVDGAGERTVSKALTTHEALADGVMAAIEVAAGELGRSRDELLAATDMLVHGTTVATNAILTGTGVRTGLITTRGHEDALIIGKVWRGSSTAPAAGPRSRSTSSGPVSRSCRVHVLLWGAVRRSMSPVAS